MIHLFCKNGISFLHAPDLPAAPTAGGFFIIKYTEQANGRTFLYLYLFLN